MVTYCDLSVQDTLYFRDREIPWIMVGPFPTTSLRSFVFISRRVLGSNSTEKNAKFAVAKKKKKKKKKTSST
ncbi:hypothetical protein WN51_01867 [Melipona quadrifasciata]|uniref:Uncharacterized protein n=1 Tax=Melipona quadrifasciata TaxID=166423 RepID=A0A0M8ZXI1_9HYME|nr:hypothetical protein WN51_01867 [Melipona quadrifasciata]